MNLIFGISEGSGLRSRIWWIVGTAVYQFALCSMKLSQNSEAENLRGTMTDPPDDKGDKKPARSPCTWKSGITRRVRSSGLRL